MQIITLGSVTQMVKTPAMAAVSSLREMIAIWPAIKWQREWFSTSILVTWNNSTDILIGHMIISSKTRVATVKFAAMLSSQMVVRWQWTMLADAKTLMGHLRPLLATRWMFQQPCHPPLSHLLILVSHLLLHYPRCQRTLVRLLD
jgi:hypothetical protein